MKLKPKVKTVDTGSFIVPLYDISGKMKDGNYEFIYIPVMANAVSYDVYGYQYKSGKGWKLIHQTEMYEEALKVAKEHNKKMAKYWDLRND